LGAWGSGVFENDDAADWMATLEESRGRAHLLRPLTAIESTGKDECLEAPEAAQALAALETIAAILGRPGRDLPDEVTRFVERAGLSLNRTIITRALEVLDRIRERSELRDLWAESGSVRQWKRTLDDLQARLRATKSSKASRTKPAPSAVRPKAYRHREGDLIEIDLGGGVHAYARSLVFPEMAFYELRATSAVAMTDIVAAPIAFRIWVSERAAVRSGRWRVLGNAPLEGSLKEPSWFFKAGSLPGKGHGLQLYRDPEERPATAKECSRLELAAVWGPAHVEDRLRDHFAGRPCKWDRKDEVLRRWR
jgi:hypothetical protein